MGNTIFIPKEERKKRILLSRANMLEDIYKSNVTDDIEFSQSEEINKDIKNQHYKERNLKKVTAESVVVPNLELVEQKYKQIQGRKIMSVSPYVDLLHTAVVYEGKNISEMDSRASMSSFAGNESSSSFTTVKVKLDMEDVDEVIQKLYEKFEGQNELLGASINNSEEKIYTLYFSENGFFRKRTSENYKIDVLDSIERESLEDIINTNKEEGHYPNTLIPLDHPDRKYYFLVSEKLSLAMIKFLIIQEFQPRWLDGKLLDMVTELNSAVNSSSTRQNVSFFKILSDVFERKFYVVYKTVYV